MPPKFGTSGLRGLVTDLTPELIWAYTQAFLASCSAGESLYVGCDLRPSSPRIAADVIAAARASGVAVCDCGALPTPALALAAMAAGAKAVMVTGSHIPADRNGLKFYLPSGEITKTDEAAISAAYAAGHRPAPAATDAALRPVDAGQAYLQRYVSAFGGQALQGLRIGIYEHSSVARDLLGQIFAGLGAQVVALARSDSFIPVDTEAVSPESRALFADWCRTHRLDALVSTDGDADRPMLTDARGRMIPGDVLGVLTARAVGADQVCTPVSSNSMLAQMPGFRALHLTRIGSPYVIAAMEQVLAEDKEARVVGFEANGGFLLGFTAQGPAGPIAPLMTRDCTLPMVAPLVAARAAGKSLADLVADLPPRYTASGRLTETPVEASGGFLAGLSADAEARAAFFAPAVIAAVDQTDGLRVTFDDGAIVHLRPSGNAPEFRVYTEAELPGRAQDMLEDYLARVRAAI